MTSTLYVVRLILSPIFGYEDAVEVFSFLVWDITTYILYSSLPLIVGYSVARVPDILFLNWQSSSKTCWMSLLSLTCFLLASVFWTYSAKNKFEDENNTVLKVLQIIIIFMLFVLPYLCLSISSFLLVSWVGVLNSYIQ